MTLNWIDTRTNGEIIEAARRMFHGQNFKVITRQDRGHSYTAVTFRRWDEELGCWSQSCVTTEFVC